MLLWLNTKAAFYALMAEYCAEVSYFTLISAKILDTEVYPLPEEEIKKWFERYHSERYGQKGGENGNNKV